MKLVGIDERNATEQRIGRRSSARRLHWRIRPHAFLTKMLLMALVQLTPKKSVYFVSTAYIFGRLSELQSGHGMPGAPHVHDRDVAPLSHGRSSWASQTQ
jgi:hypothetical protein